MLYFCHLLCLCEGTHDHCHLCFSSHKKRKHKRQNRDKEDAPVTDEDATKHGIFCHDHNMKLMWLVETFYIANPDISPGIYVDKIESSSICHFSCYFEVR